MNKQLSYFAAQRADYNVKVRKVSQ